MSMLSNNKHNVSPKELDNLLGQAFLNLDFNNPKNQEIMETISSHILPTHPIKAAFLNKSLITKLSIAIIAIVASILIFVFAFNPKPTTLSSNQLNKSLDIPKNLINPQQEQNHTISSLNSDSVNTSPKVINKTTNEKTSYVIYEPAIKNNQQPENIQEQKIVLPADTNYIFPVLTPEEIKITLKQKQKMIEDLAKFNRSKYVPVNTGNVTRHGSFIYEGDTLKLEHFYMQKTEVSNFEFRTFLFDLLLTGKRQQFLDAKPSQKEWLSIKGDTNTNQYMAKNYFSEKAYNDFPVVNITEKGVILYCNWLTTLTNNYLVSQGKIKLDSLRLPYDNEWILAATGGHKSYIYPWGKTSIKTEKGKDQANYKNSDYIIKNGKEKKSPISAITSYNTNSYGLYCMSGNAGEMVYKRNSKEVIIKGGNWNSDSVELKIAHISKNSLPSSMVGFRPIIRQNHFLMFGSIERDDMITGKSDSNSQFLSEEEKIYFSKQKKKMAEILTKRNKDFYSFIPMGSFIYKKDTFSVQSFYMRTTEVTNLEYRTFLADLLMQNKIEDFILAKPHQEAWVTKFPDRFNEPMMNMYFWHPAYDEYPVVNISRQAAEMYCVWLTIEANKILKENNKPLINDLRIPADLEWAYAARQYDSTARYANGHKFLRDAKGKFEVNYMCYSKEQCKYDTIMKCYIPKNKEELKETKTNAPKYIDDGGFHTVYGKSYAPNKFGLFCMAGNVSEMVNTYNKKNKTYLKKGTKGGSWFSCDYFLEIDAEDEYPDEVGASPLIGFRPVMTALQTK